MNQYNESNDNGNDEEKTGHGERPQLPKWVKRLTHLIDKYWQHHGPCNSINFKTYHDPDLKCWQIYAAPAYQEVYGNADDGKKVWTGFIFEAGDFAEETGVFVQNFAVSSQCLSCNSLYPQMMIKGKYRGHNVFIHIMLEPDKNTPSVEVLDTINKEVRLKAQDNA